jgi:GT2 family glycosyltransferase
VDNGSADGSVEYVREYFPFVDIVKLTKNYGFSVGNNKGIDLALKKYDPKYVLLLNNDTEIVQHDWLKKIIAVGQSDERVGIVGCKLIYPNEKLQYVGTRILVEGACWLKPFGRVPEVFDVDAVLGACFMIKRDVFDRIGFLDVGFSPFQHEEGDFCVRARKAGYRVCLISTVNVVHYSGQSMRKISMAYFHFVDRRNWIRFMLLNFPFSWLVKRIPYEVRYFVQARISIYGWLYNLKRLREIMAKRESRNAMLSFT